MKHIPTLTLMYYKSMEAYAYRYDDEKGLMQENGLFPTLNEAIGTAVRRLKTFTFIGIEEVL